PDQRHRAAGRTPIEQLALRHVNAIPDLLGEHAAVARLRAHHAEEVHRRLRPPARELVMRALTGEQRPPSADTRAIEGRAIFVLAVAIVVVSIPRRARMRAAAEQGIDNANGIENSL